MKNIFKSISVSLVVLAFASVVIGKASSYQLSIQNQSQYYTGTASFTEQSGGPVYVNVTGPGSFPATLNYTPTGVVINGYVTAPGTVGYAYIRYSNFGVKLSVDFTTSNVVVQDQSIVQ
jgi:hypothetical protein